MTTTWNQARRVLCVRLDSLGDVLMCTPAMRALRAQHPERSLTLLTSPAGVALAPYLDDVDDAIAWEAPWMKSSAPARPEQHLDWIASLAARGFDAAVVFTCYSQSALPAALLCQLAGIPLRLAYCREKPYQLLSDWIADPEPGALVRHEVQRQLDLVRHVGAEIADERLAFTPLGGDFDAVRRRLSRAGIDPDGRWLVLHPGASAPSRRYPPHHWQALVRMLGERIGCPLVFTGAAHEAALIERIAPPGTARAHSLAGELGVGELGALLALSSLVVSNNTGPAHLAAAVGAPVVDLYALTNPQHTPWRVPSRVLNHDVECRNCERSICPQGHHDCLEKLLPEQVVDAICSLLKQTEPYRRKEVRARS
ncbi:MAG: glycosyltransferase family 9 protein [Pseudomonadota bacterium]